jgi:hypothetical protein
MQRPPQSHKFVAQAGALHMQAENISISSAVSDDDDSSSPTDDRTVEYGRAGITLLLMWR